MAIETLTNPTTCSPMDILTSTETFVIGGILAVFFVLNEIFPMVSPKGMYLIAGVGAALVFALHMILFDIVLTVLTVLFDICALWLAIRAFSDPCGMSELQSAVVGFVFVFLAIILSYNTTVRITQSSQPPSITQSSHFKQLYHGDGIPFQSPSRTFGDGHAKMWRM